MTRVKEGSTCSWTSSTVNSLWTVSNEAFGYETNGLVRGVDGTHTDQRPTLTDYQLIKKPIAMRQISKNIQNKYKTLKQFRDDVHLMFDNARAYNGQSLRYPV